MSDSVSDISTRSIRSTGSHQSINSYGSHQDNTELETIKKKLSHIISRLTYIISEIYSSLKKHSDISDDVSKKMRKFIDYLNDIKSTNHFSYDEKNKVISVNIDLQSFDISVKHVYKIFSRYLRKSKYPSSVYDDIETLTTTKNEFCTRLKALENNKRCECREKCRERCCIVCQIIPQPPQGAQGAQGASGTQGPQGSQGTQGSQGSQGSQGIQGPQGSPGTGTQGAQGSQGTQGTQGSPGTGSQGPQGFPGTGTQGPQGPSGTGSQGPQGPSGTGSQGPQGPQGPPGTGTPPDYGLVVVGDQMGTGGPFSLNWTTGGGRTVMVLDPPSSTNWTQHDSENWQTSIAGWYRVTCTIQWSAGNQVGTRSTGYSFDNNAQVVMAQVYANIDPGRGTVLNWSVDLYFNGTSDFVEVWQFNNDTGTGSTLIQVSSAYLSIQYLHS